MSEVLQVRRDVTICLPYYDNRGMLDRQYETIRAIPGPFKTNVNLIVVDDGSPRHPAIPPNPSLDDGEYRFGGFELYRMKVDIPWNQDACRNLAVHHAKTSWVLLTDIDHLIPWKTLKAVLCSELSDECAYTFRRVTEPDLTKYKPHPNSWLMTRALYHKAGGYDERFAASFGEVWGVYGTDGAFKRQVQRIAPIIEIKAPLIRVPRDVTPDASTTTYERRSPDMEARRAKVRSLIKLSGDRTPQRLTFPWERVA